ncbi:MAG: hypothetical protein WCE73_22620 [Candidatus Angelobacter sp.]
MADAQLVIAREHGFESWPKFARRIEVINSEATAMANPVVAFIEAAIWHGTLTRLKRFWPGIRKLRATAVHVAAILGDDETVPRLIAAGLRNVIDTRF